MPEPLSEERLAALEAARDRLAVAYQACRQARTGAGGPALADAEKRLEALLFIEADALIASARALTTAQDERDAARHVVEVTQGLLDETQAVSGQFEAELAATQDELARLRAMLRGEDEAAVERCARVLDPYAWQKRDKFLTEGQPLTASVVYATGSGLSAVRAILAAAEAGGTNG